jgi:hypothetical protein
LHALYTSGVKLDVLDIARQCRCRWPVSTHQTS